MLRVRKNKGFPGLRQRIPLLFSSTGLSRCQQRSLHLVLPGQVPGIRIGIVFVGLVGQPHGIGGVDGFLTDVGIALVLLAPTGALHGDGIALVRVVQGVGGTILDGSGIPTKDFLRQKSALAVVDVAVLQVVAEILPIGGHLIYILHLGARAVRLGVVGEALFRVIPCKSGVEQSGGCNDK